MSVVRKTESVSALVLLVMSKDLCGWDDGKRCLGDGKRDGFSKLKISF